MAVALTGRRIRRVGYEPVEIHQRKFGYIPEVFFWHGHTYRVHAVERCWTVVTGPHCDGRLCFRVRCGEGTFELYQDLLANTWHVRGVRA